MLTLKQVSQGKQRPRKEGFRAGWLLVLPNPSQNLKVAKNLQLDNSISISSLNEASSVTRYMDPLAVAGVLSTPDRDKVVLSLTCHEITKYISAFSEIFSFLREKSNTWIDIALDTTSPGI